MSGSCVTVGPETGASRKFTRGCVPVPAPASLTVVVMPKQMRPKGLRAANKGGSGERW